MPIKLIDASRVAPHLYQGARPPYGHINKVYALVLTAVEYQPGADKFPGAMVMHCPMDDSGEPMTEDEKSIALATGVRVAHLLRHRQNVLVTCHMGLNRSGLISSLALVAAYKMSPTEAIAKVRSARGNEAMSNPFFVKFLYDYA